MKKTKGDTIQQLEDLRDWSQNPERYERRLNFRAEQAKKKEIKIAGIKDSSLYKLLKNPKVIGVDLAHDSIIEIINLIQNSGLVQKPELTHKDMQKNVVLKDNTKHGLGWEAEAIYKSMTPIEKGQLNFDLRKRYGHDYLRFKNNNKNIK